jgi:hypothetical protein
MNGYALQHIFVPLLHKPQVQALNYAAAGQTALFLLAFSFLVLTLTYLLQRKVKMW